MGGKVARCQVTTTTSSPQSLTLVLLPPPLGSQGKDMDTQPTNTDESTAPLHTNTTPSHAAVYNDPAMDPANRPTRDRALSGKEASRRLSLTVAELSQFAAAATAAHAAGGGGAAASGGGGGDAEDLSNPEKVSEPGDHFLNVPGHYNPDARPPMTPRPRLPPGWTCETTGDGYIYYFNSRTGESQWTPPEYNYET